MSQVSFECKDDASYNYAPVYLACFGMQNLPISMKADIGPCTSPPGYDCGTLGLPTTQSVTVTIVLEKLPGCNGNDLAIWNFSFQGALGFGASFTLRADPSPFVSDPNLINTSAVYKLGGGENYTGSCAYDVVTNTFISFELAGTWRTAGPGTPDPCICPFRIYLP